MALSFNVTPLARFPSTGFVERLPTLRLQRYTPLRSSKSFLVFTFRPVIHLKLILR